MDKEILSIIMLVVFLLLVGLVIFVNNSKALDDNVKKKINNELSSIKTMIGTKNPLIYRDLIIRLDSLLSKSFKIYFSNSETCGYNLKEAKLVFEKKHYNEIWLVHKLRNRVVHENEEVDSSQVQKSYNIIERAIKKLLYG